MSSGDSGSASSSAGEFPARGPVRPIVMPEAFSAAKDEDWFSWIQHFEDCADLNEWSDEKRCKFLSVRLRGTAMHTAQDLPADVRTDYNAYTKALTQAFMPKERVDLYKTEFRSRRRHPNERLGELAAAVRKLCRLAYPTAGADLVDQLAVDQFIDALDGRDTRLKVRETNPATLDEAVSRALQLEAMAEAENQRTRSSQNVRLVGSPMGGDDATTTRLTELLEKTMTAMEQMVNLVGRMTTQNQPRQSRNPRWPRRCYHCQQEGHFKRNCPELQGMPSGNERGLAPRVDRQSQQ